MLKGIESMSFIHKTIQDPEQAKLKKVCLEFESLFITHMLRMGGSHSTGGLLSNSNESKIIKSMYDEDLARRMASGGGMGLGDMLYERLKDTL
jgi:flagellar protein FlgJ